MKAIEFFHQSYGVHTMPLIINFLWSDMHTPTQEHIHIRT